MIRYKKVKRTIIISYIYICTYIYVYFVHVNGASYCNTVVTLKHPSDRYILSYLSISVNIYIYILYFTVIFQKIIYTKKKLNHF